MSENREVCVMQSAGTVLDVLRERERPEWTEIMARRRRKTLVVCGGCHADIHPGRPFALAA